MPGLQLGDLHLGVSDCFEREILLVFLRIPPVFIDVFTNSTALSVELVSRSSCVVRHSCRAIRFSRQLLDDGADQQFADVLVVPLEDLATQTGFEELLSR